MTKERRRRRQIRQAERRKEKRWHRALAGLNDPVILVLEAGQADRIPMSFLGLPKLKERIRDHNLALALARLDVGDELGDLPSGQDSEIDLPRPKLMKSQSPIDLARFETVHAEGRRAYQCLVTRGELAPVSRGRWAVICYADLASTLPFNLRWKRRRNEYLINVVRDDAGRIVTIQAYSTTWYPLFERQIKWPASVIAGTATLFPK